MPKRIEQYDYDHGPDGPLAALQARSTSPNFPGMIAPPKGWIPLVQETDAALSMLVPDYTIAQVKEKLGGLRYYVDSWGSTTDEDIIKWATNIVRQSEGESYSICQVCSEVAEQLDEENYFEPVLCAAHRVERNSE